MHIPANMLNGAVCPVTIAVGVAGGVTAIYLAQRQEAKPSLGKFAAVTAMIFAIQMLNFPVQSGTSGHLLGGMIAVSLLGTPFAVLSITLVLAVQAFFFGDGGVNAIGANVLNMGIIGTAAAGLLFEALQKKGMPRLLALALASWLSVVLAAAATSLEVAFSGAVALEKILPAMLSVHALIGVGEALLTVAVVFVLVKISVSLKANEKAVMSAAFVLAIVSALSSPFASSFPDGLEWVAEKLSFAQFGGFSMPVFFSGYQVSFVSNAFLSTAMAGLVGVGIIFAIVLFTGMLLKKTLRPV